MAKCRGSRVLRRLRGSRGGRWGGTEPRPPRPPGGKSFTCRRGQVFRPRRTFQPAGERDLRRPAGAGAGERGEERRGGARSPAREGATGEGRRGGGSRVGGGGGGGLDKGSPGDSAGLSPRRREWEAERARPAPRAPPHRRLGRFPGRPSPSRERRVSALPSRVSLPGARRAEAISPRQFGDGASRRKRCSSGGTGPRGGVGGEEEESEGRESPAGRTRDGGPSRGQGGSLRRRLQPGL